MTDRYTRLKSLIAPLRRAMYDFDTSRVCTELAAVSAPDACYRLSHPFGDSIGSEAHFEIAYAPLVQAWPDLERRDYIVIAGTDGDTYDWVGCCGYYTGTFSGPWLDIPPTGHQVHMRFHEFYRFEADRIVECQAIWDIPEVMMQANAWPMAPSLGREWHVPGPVTQDGLTADPYDDETSAATCRHIVDMIEHLQRHPAQGGPEVMQMDRYWHPRMNWYGPSGIGTARGITGFRNLHQIPFLRAMPDRGQATEGIAAHFIGDGKYAAVTGWPNMKQTITGDGWLGIAPGSQAVTLRSLDFWRLENGLIRENWVLIDLLDVFRQLGVDVFQRLREFNKAGNTGRMAIAGGAST
ncbi:ester cyclase [Hoeflea sp. TYP-13]|uniref:ester cyclase n=1 Tax=Hoeflea sp. TYP-13 TaxID=3230023 RepID=UPI0034C60865